MDAMDYWKKVGTKRVEKVAIMAGTTLAYFRHIAKARKCPRFGLAQRLVDASIQESKRYKPQNRYAMKLKDLLKTRDELTFRRIQLLGRHTYKS